MSVIILAYLSFVDRIVALLDREMRKQRNPGLNRVERKKSYTLGDVIIFTRNHARLEIQQISQDTLRKANEKKENFEIEIEKVSDLGVLERQNVEGRKKCDECKMNVNISRR